MNTLYNYLSDLYLSPTVFVRTFFDHILCLPFGPICETEQDQENKPFGIRQKHTFTHSCSVSKIWLSVCQPDLNYIMAEREKNCFFSTSFYFIPHQHKIQNHFKKSSQFSSQSDLSKQVLCHLTWSMSLHNNKKGAL